MRRSMPASIGNGLDAPQRHPTTFASMALRLAELCHAPSRHWQRYGSTYVPLWSSQSTSTGWTGGEPALNSFKRCSLVAMVSIKFFGQKSGQNWLDITFVDWRNTMFLLIFQRASEDWRKG